MEYYKTRRIVDSKLRSVVVDEDGKIVNRSPSEIELKWLKEQPRTPGDTGMYTDKELLDYVIQFVRKYRKIPTREEFSSTECPSRITYVRRFGSWSNTLKLLELDVDTIVKDGIISTNDQKARYAEIKVINHFKEHPVDLAGENKCSPFDGICPNGMIHDVKSSKFSKLERYKFNTVNKYKEEIELYYFLAFNEDWTKLDYVWRVPGEMVEKDYFQVGLNPSCEFDIDDMDKYDITDKFKDIAIL